MSFTSLLSVLYNIVSLTKKVIVVREIVAGSSQITHKSWHYMSKKIRKPLLLPIEDIALWCSLLKPCPNGNCLASDLTWSNIAWWKTVWCWIEWPNGFRHVRTKKMFDQMFVVIQIVKLGQRRSDASNKVSKRENVWSSNNAWLCLIGPIKKKMQRNFMWSPDLLQKKNYSTFLFCKIVLSSIYNCYLTLYIKLPLE